MSRILILMVLALTIPIMDSLRTDTIWEKMLDYASVSTKAAMLLLTFSIVRADEMIGFVAVVALSMGNAGLILLAYLLKRLEIECD